MKELTMPQAIYDSTYDITIRPFITANEMDYIVTTITETSNVVNKKIAKDLLVLKFCTDIENVDELDYDLAKCSGLIEKVIQSTLIYYQEIDRLVKQQEGLEYSMKMFVDNVSSSLEKLTKSFPKSAKGWDKIINQLKSTVTQNDNK